MQDIVNFLPNSRVPWPNPSFTALTPPKKETTVCTLTDSFVEKVEDLGVLRESVLVLGPGDDVIHGSRVQISQLIEGPRREAADRAGHWDVDGLPSARLLVDGVPLLQRESLRIEVIHAWDKSLLKLSHSPRFCLGAVESLGLKERWKSRKIWSKSSLSLSSCPP